MDTNGNADLLLNNVTNWFFYQLLSTTNLSLVTTNAPNYTQNWQLGPVSLRSFGATQLGFSAPTNGQPIQFFRVHEAYVDLAVNGPSAFYQSSISNGQYGVACGSTNGAQDVIFMVGTPNDDSDLDNFPTNNLTVYYQLGGSAVSGVDYTNSATGSLVISNGTAYSTLTIHPLWQCSNGLPLDSTITLTLLQNSNYVIEPSYATGIATILSTNFTFTLVTNLTKMDGLDYDSVSNCLIGGDNGNNGYLVQIETNRSGLVVTQFTGMTDFGDYEEPEVAVVKVTTNGYTNGWIYVANGNIGAIGRVSPDGTSYTNNWVTLPGTAIPSQDVHPHILLYVDQTGIFSNDLVAVAGNSSLSGYTNTIWLVDSTGKSTLLTTNLSDSLEWEGLITLPNDTNKYGVFAGKMVIGVESGAKIYTVDTNGTMTPYYTTNWAPNGIQPECFNVIPTNVASQNLYWATEESGLFKMSGANFTNYTGDLLITQGGEVDPGHPPSLFVAHWNTNSLEFDLKFISVPSDIWKGLHFEDVTFAPLNLPP
jgi:hypothetical protein